jgi:hypothetical protein
MRKIFVLLILASIFGPMAIALDVKFGKTEVYPNQFVAGAGSPVAKVRFANS